MPLFLIPLVAILMFFRLMVSVDTVDDGTIAAAQVDVNVIGQSMLALHTYAASFAHNNPGYSGTASAATLGAPAWYVQPSYVSVYVSGGKSYVYYTGSVQGLPGYLISVTQDPYGSGTDLAGVLASPGASAAATAGLAIPGQVPNGSVVVMP
ncbi:hypothetical protein R70006_04967 [Paraburkholderia domus]|uniref:type IV pilus biogenesis protein PilM n=1 Tax=Paraburkholderia domus TaxID=2793075 RepID=UPI0019124EE1|nr:type IV pilus biogenesis protein PilM [Paraburkholderia domus]MBK5051797.1 type IV pilus biogenesis protein PilM [Burkholderia sp. R-70006]CAE6793665.1 hypothetical protein R70006_04967 [Paraburkholderia domus]